jgi:hypothetical protein
MNRVKLSKTPFECPVCGERLQAKSKACPECGACERSGWNRDSPADGLDLPDRDFDYDGFVAEEFGSGKKASDSGQFFWQVVAVIVLLALGWALLRG